MGDDYSVLTEGDKETMVEYAAEIFTTYGPLASDYTMLFLHCKEKGMTDRLAEHFVIRVMDAMK